MSAKDRLSVSVDAELIEAARAAVGAGRAGSVSAWVSEAMRRQVDHESRLVGLADFVADYEAEHGVITEEEMRDAERRARSIAIVVRGNPDSKQRRGRGAA